MESKIRQVISATASALLMFIFALIAQARPSTEHAFAVLCQNPTAVIQHAAQRIRHQWSGSMPGSSLHSGAELNRHLMDAGYAIPTILVTAYPDDVDRARALNDGVSPCGSRIM